MDIRGILDIDIVCLQEIFKYLTPLDLCTIRQSCTQLKESVAEHCRSLYLVRERRLDLTIENITNVTRILKCFGGLVRRLEVGEWTIKTNLLLDVIVTDCCAVLKSLTMHHLKLRKERFTGLFNNLEILELIYCCGDRSSFENILLGNEYPKLKTLNVKYSYVGLQTVEKFFHIPRNIKKLSCDYINNDILTLVALNASEIEELYVIRFVDSTISKWWTQLIKLKRLDIGFVSVLYESLTISLIKKLKVNNKLEMLGINGIVLKDQICDALSELTNLKELRLSQVPFGLNDKSFENIYQKLSKLDSLMLVSCPNFPYRKFLTSACKSEKFRTIFVCVVGVNAINDFIEEMLKDFIDGRRHRCFVPGNTLYVYIKEEMFNYIEASLTHDNLQSVQKYGNIKILRAKRNTFFN